MLNMVCNLGISFMELIINHNVGAIFILSGIAIRYINKVLRNKKLSIFDNLSLGVYILFICTM